MKIDEFINSIRNFDKQLNVYQYPKSLWITYNSRTFVKVPFNAKTIFDCKINDELEELTDDIKITVSNKINKLLRTPIKERFPEKKYVLSAIRCAEGPLAIKQYVDAINIGTNNVEFHFGLADEKADAMEFTQKELGDLSDFFPKVAIDAMKEPVEVKNND